MKGFIEVTNERGHRIIINLSSVTDFLELNGEMYVGFITNKEDFTGLKESYEQIKELIKQATEL